MTTRQPSIADAINMEHALEFSWSSYHADAIDYLCLFRSTALTLKAYFFDNGSNDAVVVPHNHRYDFHTRVVRGSLAEQRYTRGNRRDYDGRIVEAGEAFVRYRYECIVDGGDGFAVDGAEVLCRSSARQYVAGQHYFNAAHVDIHTLCEVERGTILLLTQFADVAPSHTYGWSNTAPQCADKYHRMERPRALELVERLDVAMRENGGAL